MVPAGVAVITRRVAVPSHTQSTFYGEGGFIEDAARRSGGDREGRKGRAAYKRGGDVIADHPPLGSIGEPVERHGSSNLRIGAPGGSAIRRGRDPRLQLARCGGAVCTRGEVERHHPVSGDHRSRIVHGPPRDGEIPPPTNKVE